MTQLDESIVVGQTAHISDHERIHVRHNEVANVRDLGAIGDGVANDTVPIHAARDTGIKKVYFPDGTYLVSGLSHSVADQIWELSPGAVIKLANSSNATVVTLSGARTKLLNGKVDGNKANQTAGNGVQIAAADCEVSGVRVVDAEVFGIYAVNVDRPRITRNTVTDSGNIGIFVEATGAGANISDPLIADNVVDRSAIAAASIVEGGIKVHSVVGTDRRVVRAKVHGNTVLLPTSPTDGTALCIEVWGPHASVAGNTTSGGVMGISIGRWEHDAVTGNTVYNASTYGIEAAAHHTAVNGNTIEAASLTPSGIVVPDTWAHVNISGNVIRNTTTHAIHNLGDWVTIGANNVDIVAGYGVNVAGGIVCSVSGNIIRGNTSATKAIMLANTSYVAVSGNACSNFTENGVLIYGDTAMTIQHITLCGNAIVSCNVPVNTQLSGGAALGSDNVFVGNTGNGAFMLDWMNNVFVLTYDGSPEGAITAGVGSTYHRRNGGAATTFYVKESGTGNTGWVAK